MSLRHHLKCRNCPSMHKRNCSMNPSEQRCEDSVRRIQNPSPNHRSRSLDINMEDKWPPRCIRSPWTTSSSQKMSEKMLDIQAKTLGISPAATELERRARCKPRGRCARCPSATMRWTSSFCGATAPPQTEDTRSIFRRGPSAPSRPGWTWLVCVENRRHRLVGQRPAARRGSTGSTRGRAHCALFGPPPSARPPPPARHGLRHRCSRRLRVGPKPAWHARLGGR